MEISRDALLRVVKGTRMSLRLAENMKALLINKKSGTWADEISGQLSDAVFTMIDEKLHVGQTFEDSMTMRILNGDMSDGAVTDWIMTMDRVRRRHLNPAPAEDEQPSAPHTISKERLNELYEQNGGYRYTQET